MFPYEESGSHLGKFRTPSPKLKLKYVATSPHIRQFRLMNRDYILKSICIEEEGRYNPGAESGEPDPDCFYAILIERGYTGIVLGVPVERIGSH